MATLYIKKPEEPSKKKDHIPHSYKVRRKYRWGLAILVMLLTASLYLNVTTFLR